jgi:hypothetical protein
VLTAMARSTIKFLKQQGQFNTRIAELAGCDRHTVARVLAERTEPRRRRRRRGGTLEPQRDMLLSWIREEIPATRMLELVRGSERLRAHRVSFTGAELAAETVCRTGTANAPGQMSRVSRSNQANDNICLIDFQPHWRSPWRQHLPCWR